MKRNLLAVSALATVLTGGMAVAQSQSSGQDNEMANVEAIMQRAHQTQQQNRDDAAQQKAAAKAGAHFMQGIIQNSQSDAKQQFVTPGSASAVTSNTQSAAAQLASAATASTNPQVQQLESQLAQLNQANTMFQQQTDQRIDVLNQEHTVLQGKLAQLGQVLSILNQEVTQLNQQISSAQKQLSTNLTPRELQQQKELSVGSSFEKSIENASTTQYVLYAILVLLIIIIMMLIPRRGGAKVQAVTESGRGAKLAANEISENDTSDEYDFMNSDEAIPAKLDLARAYMAMEDYKSAKKVLEQVKKAGNVEQQAEAQKMFDKIPRK